MIKPRIAASFSGGRSSAVMVDQLLQKLGSTHEIVFTFVNTGKEEEATLDFVDAVDRHFCRPRGHRVIWLEAVIREGRNGPAAKEVTYETACRKGGPFEAALAKHGIPCASHPQCTSRLKEEPMNWYRRHVLGWLPGTYDTAIGIRADEIDRVSSKKDEKRFIYPLADWGWRKRDVSQYMARFEWDLKIPGDHWGNCDCCWKKSLRKLMTRAQENPAVFDWWAEMEAKYGAIHNSDEPQDKPRVFFRKNRSAKDIVELAATTKFEPYEDDKYDDPELFDHWWDVGSACGESCEIGADE